MTSRLFERRYLQEPEVGGHTVFPTVTAHGLHRGKPRVTDVTSGGPNPVRGQEHNPHMIWQSGGPYEEAAQQCAYAASVDRGAPRNRTAEAIGFSVAPAAGDAVLFWQWGLDEDGGILPAWGHYHGACDVLQGTKYSLQAFVELPGITSRFHAHTVSMFNKSSMTGRAQSGCGYDEKAFALRCTPEMDASSVGLKL